MVCDVTISLQRAQDTLTAMQAIFRGLLPLKEECPLSREELGAMAYALQLARKAIEGNAYQALMPMQGAPIILTMQSLHAQAIHSLRHAMHAFEDAIPLNRASQTVLHGARFIVEAVLVTLEATEPEPLCNRQTISTATSA